MRQVFARGRIRLIHQQTSGHLTELPRCRSSHASSIWLTTRWHRLCEINSARPPSCFMRTLSTNQAYNMLPCVARDDFACAWIEFIARRLPETCYPSVNIRLLLSYSVAPRSLHYSPPKHYDVYSFCLISYPFYLILTIKSCVLNSNGCAETGRL